MVSSSFSYRRGKIAPFSAAVGGPGRSPAVGEPDSGVALEDDVQDEVREPRQFAVLLHNDDYTTMEFVIEVLKRFFRKTEDEAIQIMMSVHQKGKGVAGVYTQEIAEAKAKQVMEQARNREFPLLCTVEPC